MGKSADNNRNSSLKIHQVLLQIIRHYSIASFFCYSSSSIAAIISGKYDLKYQSNIKFVNEITPDLLQIICHYNITPFF